MAGSKYQAESTRRNRGEDFYRVMGAKGGSTRTEKTKLKGFASMSPEKLREVSQKGGMAKK